MSALTEFKKQRAAADEADREARKAQAAKFRELDKARAEFYQKLSKQLRSFNNEEVDGHKLKLKFSAKDYCAELYVDNNHFATFGINRESSSCHCENACDCEVSYWHNVDVVVHRKDDDCEVYFGCSSRRDVEKDEEFAAAMIRLMDEYNEDEYK